MLYIAGQGNDRKTPVRSDSGPMFFDRRGAKTGVPQLLRPGVKHSYFCFAMILSLILL
jgi:hypothetical protein